jgi:hypothetical protein
MSKVSVHLDSPSPDVEKDSFFHGIWRNLSYADPPRWYHGESFVGVFRARDLRASGQGQS